MRVFRVRGGVISRGIVKVYVVQRYRVQIWPSLRVCPAEIRVRCFSQLKEVHSTSQVPS